VPTRVPRSKRAKPEPKAPVTILQAMRERELFARWFKDPKTWICWTVFLASLFGLPLDADGPKISHNARGARRRWLAATARRGWLSVGAAVGV
jgi:hypothetical protein